MILKKGETTALRRSVVTSSGLKEVKLVEKAEELSATVLYNRNLEH